MEKTFKMKKRIYPHCNKNEYKAGGKFFNAWYRTKVNKELIDILSKETDLTKNELIQIQLTGSNELRGTFVHPILAIQIA